MPEAESGFLAILIVQITNDILKDYLKQKSTKVSNLRKAELLSLARDQLIKDGKLEPED